MCACASPRCIKVNAHLAHTFDTFSLVARTAAAKTDPPHTDTAQLQQQPSTCPSAAEIVCVCARVFVMCCVWVHPFRKDVHCVRACDASKSLMCTRAVASAKSVCVRLHAKSSVECIWNDTQQCVRRGANAIGVWREAGWRWMENQHRDGDGCGGALATAGGGKLRCLRWWWYVWQLRFRGMRVRVCFCVVRKWAVDVECVMRIKWRVRVPTNVCVCVCVRDVRVCCVVCGSRASSRCLCL